jgi:hypothetical protein
MYARRVTIATLCVLCETEKGNILQSIEIHRRWFWFWVTAFELAKIWPAGTGRGGGGKLEGRGQEGLMKT